VAHKLQRRVPVVDPIQELGTVLDDGEGAGVPDQVLAGENLAREILDTGHLRRDRDPGADEERDHRGCRRSKLTIQPMQARLLGRLTSINHPLRSQRGQQTMEPLWSPVVATGGNPSQMRHRRNPQNQAKTVAVGCDQLPRRAHGKGRVDATSLFAKEGVTFLAPRESRVQAQRRARELDGDSNRPEVEKRWLSSSAWAGADQVTTTASTSHAICYSRACVPL
jgi:hypothetical protein